MKRSQAAAKIGGFQPSKAEDGASINAHLPKATCQGREGLSAAARLVGFTGPCASSSLAGYTCQEETDRQVGLGNLARAQLGWLQLEQEGVSIMAAPQKKSSL